MLTDVLQKKTLMPVTESDTAVNNFDFNWYIFIADDIEFQKDISII